MRTKAVFFLLILMLLQFSWAAVASYCQHATDATAKHFGHHEHQHSAFTEKHAAPDPVKIGGEDPDCTSCHAGCTFGLTVDVAFSSMIDLPRHATDYLPRLVRPPFERLERPQWYFLA